MYICEVDMPPVEELQRRLAGVPGVHRLRHWDAQPWDQLVAFPLEQIQGEPTPAALRATVQAGLARLHHSSRVQQPVSGLGAGQSDVVFVDASTVALPAAPPDFQAGWLGYLPYDYAAQIEQSLLLGGHQHRHGVALDLYAVSLGQHTPSGKTWLFAADPTEGLTWWRQLNQMLSRPPASDAALEVEGQDLLPQNALNLLNDTSCTDNAAAASATNARADAAAQPARDVYIAGVEAIRQAILAGTIFQANLTRQIEMWLPGSGKREVVGFAERLLARSAARFGAVLQGAAETVVCASPERFFCVSPSRAAWIVATEPIKGTRPRHAEPAADAAAAADLVASEKDLAENVMIADLVRNDLSRVCTDESVRVTALCELRSFANVHHLVTRVEGQLRPGLTAIDALLAQFPCGSITGAPKWAAMDVLYALEGAGRGVYCGAIGYLDSSGRADFAVAIRTAVVQRGAHGATVTYGVGGGITLLSDAQEEWYETQDKARDLVKAEL